MGRQSAPEMDLDREAKAAADLLSQLGPDADDEDLAAGMIEGETGFFEALHRAVDEMDQADALANGIKLLIEDYTARKLRIEARRDRIRAAIEHAMTMADMTSAQIPAATLTVKNTPPKLIILDEASIPSDYWVSVKPKLDRSALRRALKDGQKVPGATQSNGGIALQVRRK